MRWSAELTLRCPREAGRDEDGAVLHRCEERYDVTAHFVSLPARGPSYSSGGEPPEAEVTLEGLPAACRDPHCYGAGAYRAQREWTDADLEAFEEQAWDAGGAEPPGPDDYGEPEDREDR